MPRTFYTAKDARLSIEDGGFAGWWRIDLKSALKGNENE